MMKAFFTRGFMHGVTFVVCGGLATSHASVLATAVLGPLVCATFAAVQLYWRAGCH